MLVKISDMDVPAAGARACSRPSSRAAAWRRPKLELNIATSTISGCHIKDLQTRLGLTLCRRGRPAFADPEGERIHAETLRLLAFTDAFRASVDDIALSAGRRAAPGRVRQDRQ